DELGDPAHQRVRNALFDRSLAPGKVHLAFLAPALHLFGELDEALGRVGTTIPQDILDVRQQLLVDVFVDFELAGVDDAHVHAGLGRLVQKRAVHRLAHHVVTSKRERQVAHPAAHESARQVFLDELGRLDEVDGEAIVPLDAGGYGEDVQVEDDVGGVEADLVD